MDRILKTHFNNFRSKNVLPPELCYHNHCQNMNLFEDKVLLEIWQNARKGLRWEDDAGNVLCGAVDEVLTYGHNLIVVDLKSRGFSLKPETADSYQDQLNIYNFLLRKNGFNTENFAFLLFYVPQSVEESGKVIFSTTLVKRNISIKDAEQIFEKAVKLLNGKCPKKGCDWCSLIDEK